ncbi:uncharacterized protein ACBT44_012056 isoform 1-T1 [Syngnathus typhle]
MEMADLYGTKHFQREAIMFKVKVAVASVENLPTNAATLDSQRLDVENNKKHQQFSPPSDPRVSQHCCHARVPAGPAKSDDSGGMSWNIPSDAYSSTMFSLKKNEETWKVFSKRTDDLDVFLQGPPLPYHIFRRPDSVQAFTRLQGE